MSFNCAIEDLHNIEVLIVRAIQQVNQGNFDNERILRVGGRIGNVSVSYAIKHPVIIPKGHPLVRFIISEFYIKAFIR